MPIYTRSLSAFGAFGSLMDATAHNIANINTQGYKRLDVNFASGPGDQGVQVARIRRDYSSGPAIVNEISYSSQGAKNNKPELMADQANAQSKISQDYAVKNQFGDYPAVWDKNADNDYAEPVFKSYAEGSNVDLPREFANLTIAETAYGANAAVVRTVDEMTGSLINVVA